MKKKLFLLSSILLLVSTLLWVKDMLEPEWKQYQVEYYEQQRKAVEKKLAKYKWRRRDSRVRGETR